jgi:DDE family transposase
MFARLKKSGDYQYVQVVHNERIDGQVRQRVIATLGRLDALQESGQLEGLLESLARFSDHAAVLNALKADQITPTRTIHLGPPLVFQRLWEELGLPGIFERLLTGRKFEFPLERVVFITVLHRLFAPGSDRAAERWCRKYAVGEIDGLELQHFYRTMGWLGEPLPPDPPPQTPSLTPRLRKDLIEEALFGRRRDLFSNLRLVFLDTTSIYFEGRGGESIGRHGHSKDHRPDRPQMIVAVVMDDQGWPVCCELLPGNTADIKTLIPVIDRLRQRFGIRDVCVVADRGMISQQTMAELSQRLVRYILGARLRNVKEIRQSVLSRGGRYREVHGPRSGSKDPSPLKVKQVLVEGRRYIVCHNEEQARKDRADRDAIVAKLRGQLKQGSKSLVGNKGYRKYLSAPSGGAFQIDEAKVKQDARFDGKWVLQTDTELPAEEVALRYKDLLLVEDAFRTMKMILKTRPIYHQCDDTIRGHVFCSFLALVLQRELQSRLESRGWITEWQRLRDDLDELQELTLPLGEKTFAIRTPPVGDAGRALQATGVALGPSVRLL